MDMEQSQIEILKSVLLDDGFRTKAFLSDERMAEVHQTLDESPKIADTPPDELRYIEGVMRLPMGHLDFFRITTLKDHAMCACGRETTALDIIETAVRREIHSFDMMRDTLIGFRNIFEFATDGRVAICYRCGRDVVAFSYWTNKYAYA